MLTLREINKAEPMDKAHLEEKLASIEQRYNATQQQRNQLNEELLRLEGEFRLAKEQLNSLEPVEQPSEETDNAE